MPTCEKTMVTREQLEVVVQKKKVSEVYNWFHGHFVSQPHESYLTKCPFVIVQGPPGCGKTTTLKCVAKELGIPIKEYSDTTDTTAINFEIKKTKNEEDRSFDRRKASRFEQFVFNNLRFNALYPSTGDSQPLARADSEFDDSDDELPTQDTQPKPPDISGIIIHVESPLMCAKSQKILISSILRMIKTIRELSRFTPRRIAVVFETLESERDALALPTKFKQAVDMDVIKFNPVIRANMKRFIEAMLRKYQNVSIDKETIEALISDCDGDLQACINTLEMIHSRSNSYNTIYMGIDDENNLSQVRRIQVNKRQRLNPDRFKFNTSLMRDVTRSLGFFHNLGKIFYQKRLYPDPRQGGSVKTRQRSIDRPYQTENDTEYLVSQLDSDPKHLMSWLHQHYYRFCHRDGIEKASLYLSHLSDVDTISMNSTQSSQFYEMHGPLDKIQLYLAVAATVYSLYDDQSTVTKSSHKTISNDHGSFTIKSSVEITQQGAGEMFSFSKPVSMSLARVIEDYQTILAHSSETLMKHNVQCVDPIKILIDHIPYLCDMFDNRLGSIRKNHLNGSGLSDIQLFDDLRFMDMIKRLKEFGDTPKICYDTLHETLLEYLGDLEQTPKLRETYESPMDLT